MFQIKTSFFIAFIGENDRNEIEGQNITTYDPVHLENDFEIPEYMFAYIEPAIKLGGFMKLGIPVEFHTNTLDSDRDGTKTIDVGGRLYLTPVENLDITAFGMVDIPVGDNAGDVGLKLGVETVFNF